MKVKVKCIQNYNDTQKGKLVTTNDEPFVVSDERAKQLVDANVCEVIEVIEEEPKEEVVEKKATKPRKKK